MTRADLATRATTINSLIASQTINSNEGRGWIGLPPREGGDEFKNPNITTERNSAPSDDASKSGASNERNSAPVKEEPRNEPQ